MERVKKQRKSIVVVEDNPDTLELICTMVAEAGFAVTGVSNAHDAVERVRERVPDLLIIDYMMPEADGLTTLQRCRALPGARKTLAVMLTADDRLATLELAIARGFDEFIPKPIMDNDEFIQRLNSVFARRGL